MLVKTNVSGPGGSDERIAKGFGRRCQTVEAIRRRSVESGFDQTSKGKRRSDPAAEKLWNEKRGFKSLDCVLECNKKAFRMGPCGNRSPAWSNRKSPRPSLMKPHVSIEQIEATGRKLQYLVVPPESDCEYLHLWGKFLMSTKAPAIQRTQFWQWMSSGSNVSRKLGSR